MGRRKSVVVAGGGIGGLAAAAGIAGRGIDVTVVERADRIGARGAGLILHPDGVRAADALGGQLGARLRAIGHVTGRDEARLLMGPDGTILAEEQISTAAAAFGAPRIAVLRSALRRTLLDEALTAGASVRPASAVEDYAHGPWAVTVRLSDGDTLEGDALIGADGMHSVIRGRMLGDAPPQYRGSTSVRGRTRATRLGQHGHVVNGPGIRLSVAPAGGGTVYWTAEITAPAGEWPAKGPDGARRALLEAMEGWYTPVVDLVRYADPQDVVVTDIHDRAPAPRWVDGRVALLGDAARPMVPALERGADMALEDAAVLADALAAHAEVPDALAAYARARIAHTAAVVPASRRRRSPGQETGRAAHQQRTAHIRSTGHQDTDLADTPGRRHRPERPRHDAAAAPTSTFRQQKGTTAMGTPHGNPHIVLVSGSLRPGSTSDRVATWCAQRCAEHGASARIFTGSEIDFPAYRPGLGRTHAAVAGFLAELRAADGVILVSPTYHATVSGLLKNALDYVNDIDGPVPYLEGRAIGTVAVGSGAQGAVSTLTTLRTIGHALRGWPTPVGVAVTAVPAEPSAAGGEAEPEAARLAEMVSQTLWLSEARAIARPAVLGTAA